MRTSILAIILVFAGILAGLGLFNLCQSPSASVSAYPPPEATLAPYPAVPTPTFRAGYVLPTAPFVTMMGEPQYNKVSPRPEQPSATEVPYSRINGMRALLNIRRAK